MPRRAAQPPSQSAGADPGVGVLWTSLRLSAAAVALPKATVARGSCTQATSRPRRQAAMRPCCPVASRRHSAASQPARWPVPCRKYQAQHCTALHLPQLLLPQPQPRLMLPAFTLPVRCIHLKFLTCTHLDFVRNHVSPNPDQGVLVELHGEWGAGHCSRHTTASCDRPFALQSCCRAHSQQWLSSWGWMHSAAA